MNNTARLSGTVLSSVSSEIKTLEPQRLNSEPMTESIVKALKSSGVVTDDKQLNEGGDTRKFIAALAQGITDYLKSVSITVDTNTNTGKF